MKMRILDFIVKNKVLEVSPNKKHFTLTTESYIFANFTFSKEWEGLDKNVNFYINGVVQTKAINSRTDTVKIPSDILSSDKFSLEITGQAGEIFLVTNKLEVNRVNNTLIMDIIKESSRWPYTVNPETEGHVVINKDRSITVPDELKNIAVQFDNNIETVTFDCPRYWDGIDMSHMNVFINYMRSDGELGCYHIDTITIDETDDNIMHFDWTISRNVTEVKGNVSFLICIKKSDSDGNNTNHWNSQLNRDFTVSEGMECEESVIEKYPDVISQILRKLDEVLGVPEEQIQNAVKDYLDKNPVQAIKPGAALEFDAQGYLQVKVANEAEKDNTLPITSAAVYTQLGNVETMLSII